MKLERGTNGNRPGTYAVVNLQKLQAMCNNPPTLGRWTPAVAQALETLEKAGAIEWGFELSKPAGEDSPVGESAGGRAGG